MKKLSFYMSALLLTLSTCNRIPDLSKEEKAAFMKEGASVVNAAGHALVAKLTEEISNKGIDGAIKYCNLNALPLLDSISTSQHKSINRSSLKLRNPKNKPEDREKMVIKMMDEAYGRDEKIGPLLDLHEDGSIYYYQPIMIQPLCLNCHGEPGKDIDEKTFNAIKALYPKDKAMGYKLGDFRGTWRVKLK